MKDMVGKFLDYRDGAEVRRCEVVAVKAGPMALDTTSKIGSPKFKATFKARLKPVDGGKPFWTPPIAA